MSERWKSVRSSEFVLFFVKIDVKRSGKTFLFLFDKLKQLNLKVIGNMKNCRHDVNKD